MWKSLIGRECHISIKLTQSIVPSHLFCQFLSILNKKNLAKSQNVQQTCLIPSFCDDMTCNASYDVWLDMDNRYIDPFYVRSILEVPVINFPLWTSIHRAFLSSAWLHHASFSPCDCSCQRNLLYFLELLVPHSPDADSQLPHDLSRWQNRKENSVEFLMNTP